MTVAFKELAGSPVETYGPEGLKAERVLLCAWDDRETVVAGLLGDGYEYGGDGRAQYPDKPDVVAIRARCEPITDDVDAQTLNDLTEGLNRYNGFAKITVHYEFLSAAERSDLPATEKGTFLTYRQDYGVETMKLSGDSFTWEDEPSEWVPEAAVPAIRVAVVKHRLTWHRAVRPPWQTIRTRIGTVNDAEFLGAAAGTVLLDGATAEREFIRIGQLNEAEFAWRLGYTFRERAVKTGDGSIVGFNHAYRSLPVDAPDWDRLIDGASNPPYPSSDFLPLFQFEADTDA